MEISLRTYQQEMINTAITSLIQDNNCLIQGATGCGKSIVFSGLVKQLLANYPKMRIAILAHRLELIQQAQDKLLKVWFDAPIGIACASANSKKETDMPITIGSIQTLVNHAATTAPFHLIIIDEAHVMPPANVDSQYKQWLDTMKDYNKDVRLLGFTATPFRLSHGYIFGYKCKEGAVNWFSKLNYKIGIRELQAKGYLCGYRAKAIVDIGNDLDRIKTTGGEFNLSELSELMSNITHVGSAVKAFKEYGEEIIGITDETKEKLIEELKERFIAASERIFHIN
jgi:DNA repair protein RadD